jgi:hypothetical protein
MTHRLIYECKCGRIHTKDYDNQTFNGHVDWILYCPCMLRFEWEIYKGFLPRPRSGQVYVNPVTWWERFFIWTGRIKPVEPQPLPPKPKAKVYCGECRNHTEGLVDFEGMVYTLKCLADKTKTESSNFYSRDDEYKFLPCAHKNAKNDCPDFETWADHINDKSQTSAE